MFSKFHDDSYDGVVIHIPSFFIAINPNLPDALKDFEKSLLACKFSTHHPDITRTLHELENRSDKKEMIQKERDRAKANIDAENDRNDRRVKKIELPVSHDVYRNVGHNESKSIRIKDKVITPYYTKKSNTITAEVKKAFEDFKASATMADLEEFLQDNSLYIPKTFIYPTFNIKSVELYCNDYGLLAVKIPIRCIELWERGKRKKHQIYSRSAPLQYNHTLQQYYISIVDKDIESDISGDASNRGRYLEKYEDKGYCFLKK